MRMGARLSTGPTRAQSCTSKPPKSKNKACHGNQKGRQRTNAVMEPDRTYARDRSQTSAALNGRGRGSTSAPASLTAEAAAPDPPKALILPVSSPVNRPYSAATRHLRATESEEQIMENLEQTTLTKSTTTSVTHTLARSNHLSTGYSSGGGRATSDVRFKHRGVTQEGHKCTSLETVTIRNFTSTHAICVTSPGSMNSMVDSEHALSCSSFWPQSCRHADIRLPTDIPPPHARITKTSLEPVCDGGAKRYQPVTRGTREVRT